MRLREPLMQRQMARQVERRKREDEAWSRIEDEEKLLRQTGAKHGTTLIRINPDWPENKKDPGSVNTIPIKDTCLRALTRIDAAIGAACLRRGVPPPPGAPPPA